MADYAFDAPSIKVEFNAKRNAPTPLIVTHELRHPTLSELLEREKQSTYEVQEVNKHEDEIIADDEIANARLWDKLILSVQGYKGFDTPRPPTDEEKAQMRGGHKTTAIRAMYAASVEIVDSMESIGLSGDTWRIKHEIGASDIPAFTVFHILREPTEGERAKFKRSESSRSLMRGGKKSRIKLTTSLKAYTELYDLLLEGIDGGTVEGQSYNAANRKSFLNVIDPLWKKMVVSCLMEALEAELLD